MAKIEIFSAGCPTCQSAERMARELACPKCELEVVPIGTPTGHARASAYGVVRAPAVVVDGVLAACCRGNMPNRLVLQAAIAA